MNRVAFTCWVVAVVIGASAGLLWVHAASGPAPAPVMDLQMDLNLPSVVPEGAIGASGATSIVGGPSPATLDVAFTDAEGVRSGPLRLHTILKRDGRWSFNLPYLPLKGTGIGQVEVTLAAGGKTVKKTFSLTITGGDFDVGLSISPPGWAYENDGAITDNRHIVTLTAAVANDTSGSTDYEYRWLVLPHPKTGKALVLLSGGGTNDAAATYAAPQAAAASKEPYVVACEVVGKNEWGLETGDALGAAEVSVRLLGDASGDGQVTVTDFSIWKSQNGQTGEGLSGDFNGDGQVTVTDFSIWKVNNGQVVPE